MTTIPTQNAVPSELPEDLKFNAGKIDEFVTSLNPQYRDRLGGMHYTIEGLKNLALQQIYNLGWNPVGTFQDGATVTAAGDIVQNETNGAWYRWDDISTLPKEVPAGSTPDSTGGVGEGKWLIVDVNDLLRKDLSKNTGAALIGTASGDNVQEGLDKLISRTDSFSYPEDYMSLVINGDWSDAIQAAWDTGKPPVFQTGFSYTVSKIITTKGQPYYGTPTLNLVRPSIPNVTVTAVPFSKADANSFRGIYVGTAYDWCEFVRIKELGLNSMIHYSYFDNNPTVDGAGTIPQMVLNARSAGLNVVVNLQHQVEHGNGTSAEIVAAVDSFDNVIGYAVLDEPGSNGVSLVDQEAAISAARALTKKKLYSVDFVWRLTPWKKHFSYNFDVFLVDSYGMYYASGDLNTRVAKDLGKFRTDFGGIKKMVGDARVIPCFQAYTEPTSNPVEGISGTYCFDVPQIAAGSRVFGKVGNGDFCCFTWDNQFHDTVGNNAVFQDVVRDVVNHAGKGEIYRTEVMNFGGVASVGQRPLTDVSSRMIPKDPENTVDAYLGGGAWPIRLTTGASETPIHTTVSGVNTGGIGFRRSFSRLVTSLPSLEYVSTYGVVENYGNPFTGAATLTMYSTPDGGYTQDAFVNQTITAGAGFRFSNKVTNFWDGTGSTLAIGLGLANSTDYMENYRRILYGLIVSTNW